MDLLLVHQIMYGFFSGFLFLIYTLQLSLRAYRVYYDLPSAGKYSSTQQVYHWCGFGSSILCCIRSIDPYGQHEILSVPALFILTDSAIQLVILAGFYTIYEALCACFHVVGLLYESRIPKLVGYTLTLLWCIVCITVVILDFAIFLNPLRIWLALIHFTDAVPFLFLVIFLQRIGNELQKILSNVLPELFARNNNQETPTFISTTPMSLSHIHHKINKFLILRRIVQILSTIGFITGIIRAVSFLRKGGTLDTKPGHYNVEDDIIGWILIVAGLVGAWYSWAPVVTTNAIASASPSKPKKKNLQISSEFSVPESMTESLMESEYYTRSEYIPGLAVNVGSYQ